MRVLSQQQAQELDKTNYDGKIKKIEKNKKKIRKTSEILKYANIVSVSPEEPDVLEIYKKEKVNYFDKKIFKIKPNYTQTIKKYNKLLKIRNNLLENHQSTKPWDTQLAKAGILVWEERKKVFKKLIKQQKETEKKITNKDQYTIKYIQTKTDQTKDYIIKLKQSTNPHKTTFGPHQDNVLFLFNKQPLQERGSQGEKKLFKYILKLTEAEFLYREKQTKPIALNFS